MKHYCVHPCGRNAGGSVTRKFPPPRRPYWCPAISVAVSSNAACAERQRVSDRDGPRPPASSPSE